MRVAMRHNGRPGAMESIGDRRVAPCTGHCLIVPLLFLTGGCSLMDLRQKGCRNRGSSGLVSLSERRIERMLIGTAWGFDVQIPILVPLLQEN